jgi:hypothetical protein
VLGSVSPTVLSELLIVLRAYGSRGRESSIATQGDHLVVLAVRRMTGPDTYGYLGNSRFCTPRREPRFSVRRLPGVALSARVVDCP